VQKSDIFPDCFSFFPTRTGGYSLEIGGAYDDDNGFPPNARGGYDRPVGHAELKIGYCRKLLTGFVGYRMNHSEIFTLYDYAVVGADFFSRLRQSRWLSFTLAAKYSRIKDERGSLKFVKKGVGVEAGMRYDGRFESFAYTYSSNTGGYHRFDASFAADAAQGLSYGTRYSFYTGKYFRMYQISFFAEMWVDDNRVIWRIRNRPLCHKVLAMVALIPLLGLVYL
jgi:hypothetical protein